MICHTRKKSGRYITDEWQESEHPRDKDGKFSSGGGNSGKVAKSSKSDKIRKRTRKEVQLPKAEYAQVIHELNTNLTKDERKMKHITRFIGDYVYHIQNNGFNEYKITGKQGIDEFYD